LPDERQRCLGPGPRLPRHGQVVRGALWVADRIARAPQCHGLRGRVPTTPAPRRASILPGSRHGAVPLASQGGPGRLVHDLQDRGPAGAPGGWPGRAGRDSMRYRHGGRARGNRPLREGAARDVAVRLLSMRRLLVGGGLACLPAAAAWRLALASRWTQRLPPGWSARERYAERGTYRLRSNYVKGIALGFTGEDDLDGLTTYRFAYQGRGEYTESYSGTAQYPGVHVRPGEEIRCADDQFYFNVWIEPVTGELVKLEEGCPSGDYVYDVATNEQRQAVDRWHGVTDGDAVIQRIAEVRRLRWRYLWAARYLPLTFLAAGAVLLGLGVRRPPRSRAPRPSPPGSRCSSWGRWWPPQSLLPPRATISSGKRSTVSRSARRRVCS